MAVFSKYSLIVNPSGIGKSGRKTFPNSNSKLHLLAISRVLEIADGISSNKVTISSGVLKYCSAVKFLGLR